MGKKRNGGKKTKKQQTPSKRPPAPSFDFSPKSAPPDSVAPASDSVHDEAADSEREPVAAEAQATEPPQVVAEPPKAADSLAPTSSPPDAEAPSAAADAVSTSGSHKPVSTSGSHAPLSTSGAHQVLSTSGSHPALSTSGSHDPMTRSQRARRFVEEGDVDRAFFEGEAEAVAKMHAEEVRKAAIVLEPEPEVIARQKLTPEMIARRGRLRRIVTGVVAVAAVMSGIVAVRAATAQKHAFVPPPPVAAAPRGNDAFAITTGEPVRAETHVVTPKPTDEAPKAEEKKVDDAKPEEKKADDAPKAEEKKADDAKPEEKKADDAKPEEKKADDAPKAEEKKADEAKPADPAAAKALAKKAASALDAGKFATAIEASQAAIDADPTDANPYLYWGTALLETGKRSEAKAIFAKCVEQATHGPKSECRQFK